MNIAEIPLTTIDGRAATLDDYPGEVKLIVNVASRCGLTPQYEKLEQLQRSYEARGFTVLGFPSNQFDQELGSDAEIAEYCSATWGVTFPMFERVALNGDDRHPLYAELTRAQDAQGEAGDVRWNFEKFLIAPDGAVTRFSPMVTPEDPALVEAIEATLPG